ncbi:MAG TPA: universal stress protein [Candidatus Kapabacteria bacterium]|nr:universal stress protein [Candidatus Kapabacteria bacterium]
MADRFKVLIAYDGSDCADAALADLQYAGLPPETDALVVSIAEVWVKDEGIDNESAPGEAPPAQVMSLHARSGLQKAQVLARKAVTWIGEHFPAWHAEGKVYPDSPSWGILNAADEWKPDLIVVGSHGRSLFGRVILGSVSQKVLTEAACSVRIGRSTTLVHDAPLRLVIGMDDTPDSTAAVEVIARRNWPAGTSVRVVCAVELADLPIGIPLDYDVTQWATEGTMQLRQRMEKAGAEAVARLGAAGLLADLAVREGAASAIILAEARDIGANCIVLGARGHRFLERFLLGSVSLAVARHADCTVEIVRSPKAAPASA